MSHLGKLLQEWGVNPTDRHGSVQAFIDAVRSKNPNVKLVNADFTRAINGRAGPVILAKLVAAVSPDKQRQAALCANYLLDQLPAKFCGLVKIGEGPDIISGDRVFEYQLDESQRILAEAEEFRREPEVAAAIGSLGLALKGFNALRKRSP